MGDLVRHTKYGGWGIFTGLREETHLIDVTVPGKEHPPAVWRIDRSMRITVHDLTDEEVTALMKWELTRP